MTKAQITTCLIQAIPYPEQIQNLDFESESTAIRFEWRGTVFRISDNLDVDTVDDTVLVGSNDAILLRGLLKKTAFFVI